MLEKGRLYSLRKDYTKDPLYLNIKKKIFLFGSSEYCTVRIYIDGIFPEHCVLTIGDQGKAFLEPLHPSALTLVNGIKIKHKVCLEDNDVVTIVIKEFQFAYPPNSSSKKVYFERLILSSSKQLKPAEEFGISILGQNLTTLHPFRESRVSNVNCIPTTQISIIKSDILKKITEYLFQFMHQEPVNILYEKINAQEVHSCSNKSLMRYVNQYVKESTEERKKLTLKLYEFMSFFRGLLNRNEEYLYDLWLILECIWKYCITRANEDILFLPLKSLNLNKELTVYKKSLQSRILKCTKNSSPVSITMSEKEIHPVNGLEVNVSSDYQMEGQNQYSSKKISFSYKKRVSLAVKRYHLRRRKEIEIVENLELLGKRQKMKDGCREINSDKQDVVLNLEKQRTTRRKRDYNKKGKEELPRRLEDQGDLKIKKEINVEVFKDLTTEKLNSTSEQMKETRRNEKALAKKTDLRKENITELTDDSPGNQIIISKMRKQKQPKGKQNSKNKGLKQEYKREYIENSAGEQTTNVKTTETSLKRSYKRKKKEAETNKTGKFTQESNTQEVSGCQRITRSMAKNHH